MGILKRDRKKRSPGARAFGRAVFAWIGLAVINLLDQGGSSLFLYIPFVFLYVTSPVMAASATFFGHRAFSRASGPSERTTDGEWRYAAVVLGYLWWFIVCVSVAQGLEGLELFAYALVLIESPMIIYEGGRGNGWMLVASILILAVVTGVSIADARFPHPAPAIIGALELTVLAGWWPFRAHKGLPNRTRVLVAAMLYLFAVLALIGAYLRFGP